MPTVRWIWKRRPASEIDGDWVQAKGTSLGADDGIAVAYALAILAADDIPHPALEAVFTVGEEVGLTGQRHWMPLT